MQTRSKTSSTRKTRKIRGGNSKGSKDSKGSKGSKDSKGSKGSKDSKGKPVSAESYVIDTCPICFDHLSTTPIIVTKCKHAFHENCLIGWCSAQQHGNKTCPVCRADIETTCNENAHFNSLEIFRYIGPFLRGGEDYNNAKALTLMANPKFDPNVRATYFPDDPETFSLFWHLVRHLHWKLLEELLKHPDLVIPVADAAAHAGSDKVRKLVIKYKKVPKALKKLWM